MTYNFVYSEKNKLLTKSKNLLVGKWLFKNLLKKEKINVKYCSYHWTNKEKQIKLIKEVRDVNKISNIETPYRIGLLETNIPHKYKSIAFKKLESLKYMEPGSGEFYKIKNWVDTFMRIPI